jgi:hypothetical protein
MTMQSASDCPQIKTGKNGEPKTCGRPRLYYVQEEENENGFYYVIARGTPAHPPELCKACALLDANARNVGQRVRRGLMNRGQEAAQEAQEAPLDDDPPLGPA